MSKDESLTVRYTNYLGETSIRTITPKRIWWGSTEWHSEPQWLLSAFDHGKQDDRDFTLLDMTFGDAAALRPDEAAGQGEARKAADAEVARLKAGLQSALEEIVLVIAFIGRDRGTDRLDKTLDSLVERCVKADAAIRSLTAAKGG